MVFFSCTLSTYRYGGVDIMAASLAKQTFDDFECIFVDELYSLRKHIVREYLEKIGVLDNIIHIPPKKRDVRMPIGMQNGRNTGLLLAEGQYSVQFDDYTLLAPYCFDKFYDLHLDHPNDILLGIRRNYKPPEPVDTKGMITVFQDPLVLDTIPTFTVYPLYQEYTGLYPITRCDLVLNLGAIPLREFLEIGGYDERYDNGHGYDDSDLMYRMYTIGKKAWMDTDNVNAHIRHDWDKTKTTTKNALLFNKRRRDETVMAEHTWFDINEWRDLFLSYKDDLKKGLEPKELPLRWSTD